MSRIVAIAVVIVALLIVTIGQGQAKGAILDDAILVLSFDQSSMVERNGQTMLKDLSGKGNHCQVKGPTMVKGVAGEALSFNGSGHVVAIKTLHSHLAANLKGVTVSAWILNTKGAAYGKI